MYQTDAPPSFFVGKIHTETPGVSRTVICAQEPNGSRQLSVPIEFGNNGWDARTDGAYYRPVFAQQQTSPPGSTICGDNSSTELLHLPTAAELAILAAQVHKVLTPMVPLPRKR